jgi:alkaline phosphatase
MKKIINVLVMFILVVTLWADDSPKAKYIFLMIGDGMGMTHRNIAEYYKRGIASDIDLKDSTYEKLNMNTFPIQALCATYSENSIVTDSAAAATAFATGHKTKSGVISMNADGTESYTTIAEIAKERGMKVGIVTSVSIDHATPAAFYSHRPSRGMYYEISTDLASSGFDYFGGSKPLVMSPSKLDGKKSPIDCAIDAGYTVVSNKADLLALEPKDDQLVWAFTSMQCVIDREDNESPDLIDFTESGIELLDGTNGFFMMVEGGRIDWASHQNDVATMVNELLEFDDAVGVAYDFYEKHPDETLIIVVGDHETGGLSFGSHYLKYAAFPDKIKTQTMSQGAFGSIVKKFRSDNISFEEALPKIQEAFGFEKLSDTEKKIIEVGYKRSMVNEKDAEDKITYGSYDPLAISCCRVINNRSGLAWTTFAHTGVPVQVSVIGVGQNDFNGLYDNTDIFKKIKKLLP